MILKVISGGQTGADRAGLDAAKRNGLSTGGTAPKDFYTTDGPAPELAGYGLIELDAFGANGYRKRTKLNVGDCDLTIAIASHFNSPGEILTRNACKNLNKSIISFHFSADMDVQDWLESEEFMTSFFEVSNFIKRAALTQDQFTLNVAGNSARTSPRSYMFSFAACDKIFKKVIEDEKLTDCASRPIESAIGTKM